MRRNGNNHTKIRQSKLFLIVGVLEDVFTLGKIDYAGKQKRQPGPATCVEEKPGQQEN